MPKVSIPQKQMTIDVEPGANLMNALLNAGLPVASSCHGDGICSMCRVRLTGDAVNPPVEFEINSMKRNKCAPDERLSCQVEVRGDLTVQTKYW
jgi:2Fe-2S ferredoxin